MVTYYNLLLNKKSIQVISYASDGDSKLLKAMKIVTGIGTLSCEDDIVYETIDTIYNYKYFNCEKVNLNDPVCFQDFNHILTKLRNRVLRQWAILPFGSGAVSKTFLKYLIDKVPKDKHGLTASDIDPKDRQNVKSANSVCDLRTQSCLTKYVPGSKSTVLYLKVMRSVTSSMLDSNMEIRDRILQMWYGVFVLRLWRWWVTKFVKPKKARKNEKINTAFVNLSNPTYSLQENFISANCYTCIEINAHSLIQLILKLRNMNRPDMFLPMLMGSQSCKSTFRQLRSMTTTYSTVVNFTMLEMIGRIKKKFSCKVT